MSPQIFIFFSLLFNLCGSLPQNGKSSQQLEYMDFHDSERPTDLSVDIGGFEVKSLADTEHTTLPSSERSQLNVQTDSSIIPDISSTAATTVRPKIPIAQPNFPRVATPFVIAMWVLSICISKIVLNSWPKLLSFVPESCCLIVVGIGVGFVLYMTNTTILTPLSSTIFFFCMLPPIILDAGYFMPNRPFFDHLGTILLFAVVGTIFNTICIGVSLWACGLTGLYGFEISLLETLIFSSLISAVDPVAVLAVFEEIHVDQVLYIIVFGESLLNDAVTVVLYNMFYSYNSIGPENIGTADVLSGFASFTVVALGGTAIGVFWGFLTGFVTKYTHRVLVIEPIFVFIMSYVAYINAEAFQMSGILSIMFCGITMKNYVAENVTPTSLTTVRCGLKVLSNGSESIIFMFLGISTVNDYHEWNTAFILLTVLFCSFYRALGVIILTEIANYFRLHQLNGVEKLVMSYGGLRGAIAFALVLLIDPNVIPHQPLFVTATISVVFFTVFVQGITMKPLVKLLKVKREERREKTMNERMHEKMLDYSMAGVVDILGQMSSNKVRDKFKQWDYACIRPYLIREKKHNEPKIIETYSKLTLQDAIELTQRKPSSWTGQGNDSFANFLSSQNTTTATNGQVIGGVADCFRFEPSSKDLSDSDLDHCRRRNRVKASGAVHKHRTDRRKPYRHEIKNLRLAVQAGPGNSFFRGSADHLDRRVGETNECCETEGGISFIAHPLIHEERRSQDSSAGTEIPSSSTVTPPLLKNEEIPTETEPIRKQ